MWSMASNFRLMHDPGSDTEPEHFGVVVPPVNDVKQKQMHEFAATLPNSACMGRHFWFEQKKHRDWFVLRFTGDC